MVASPIEPIGKCAGSNGIDVRALLTPELIAPTRNPLRIIQSVAAKA